MTENHPRVKTQTASASRFPSRRNWILGLLLALVTLAAYQPAWNGGLLWDDDLNVTATPRLHSLDGLVSIWTHPGATLQYYPLVHTVFWLEYHLWSGSTLGYHLVNILLHIVSALLLVVILRRLGVRAAWLAGWLFALHPVMAESVAWITELKNTLSGVFFMSAALAYLSFDENREKRWYLLSTALFILGLLSKTSIVPFPLAMLAVIWWKRGRVALKRDIVPLLPLVAVGVLSGLVTIFMEHTFVGTRGREFDFSFVERTLIAGRAFWFYLAKIVWPGDLLFIYPRWKIDAASLWQYLFPAAVTAAAVLLGFLRKWRRGLVAAFFYFAAMLFPVAGFLSQYAFRYSFVADHWVYLAAVGPLVLAAAGIHSLVQRAGKRRLTMSIPRWLPQGGIVGVLGVLALLTFNQARSYADAGTLFRETIRKNPGCWMAYNNLGVIAAGAGHTDEAMARYREALELNPDNSNAHCNLANALARIGRLDEAVAQYESALRIEPDYAEAHSNLGNVLLQTGQGDAALVHFQRAVAIQPENGDAHYNLGLLLAKFGRIDEAMAHLRKAEEEAPGNAAVCYNLGNLLAQEGRWDEAVAQYRRALELDPGNAEACTNLGNLLAQAGRTTEAVSLYRRALQSAPGNAQAHNNLGILLAQSGRLGEAMAHYRKALELSPGAIDPVQNLAFAFVQLGKGQEAVAMIRGAIASAKSGGDSEREKALEDVLTRLRENVADLQTDTKSRRRQ